MLFCPGVWIDMSRKLGVRWCESDAFLFVGWMNGW